MSARKPAARRQNRETADIGVIATVSVITPPAPQPGGKPLLPEIAEAWETFWTSDVAGLVNAADRAGLTRLFGMYDRRERLDRLVFEQPMVEGSQGQPRMNPAAAEVASLDARILALEDRFGLSPSARLKLGIVLGAAAKSLEEMNRAFHTDEAEAEEEDPRVIDVASR